MSQIKELQKECHEIAVEKGFYDKYNEYYTLNDEKNRPEAELICLMHSELSEALEAVRSNNTEENNLGEEMADVVIRILDACGYWQIDLETEILKKIEKNKSRPYKHNKKF